jgi:hypothetical protein
VFSLFKRFPNPGLVILFATLFSAGPCVAAGFDPYQGPKPLVIFIQSNPWGMAIGSDTPRVAVYENGDAIFLKDIEGRLTYHYVALDKNQLESVRAHLKPVSALKDLKRRYNIRPNWSDQPKAIFYLRDGERDIATSVYGLKDESIEMPGYTESPGRVAPTTPPNELLELHRWLCALDYPGSEEWKPKYVEVMLWDYSYAPDASIDWPKDWPSLDSDRAIKRESIYSVYLDGTMLPKLRAFLKTRKEKGPVEISGKKMTASYRFVFPSERIWRKALAPTAHEGQDRE